MENSEDFTLNPVWGGMPRTGYYAPDGTYEECIPQRRVRRNGTVYDVRLAGGYTLTPPANPKLHCKGCGKWHDTQEEVTACIERRKAFMAKYEKLASKQHKGSEDRIKELEDKIDKLTKLIGGKNGEKI